jgi:FkbM family methyltransferase
MEQRLSSGHIISDVFIRLFKRLRKRYYPSDYDICMSNWLADKGDQTLRMNYDLNEDSVVIDLGGYEGQWSSDIFSRYCSNIHILEPVPQFYHNIKERFLPNDKIVIHNCGLSNSDSIIKIALADDGSSAFRKDRELIEVKLKEAVSFFANIGVNKIDLIKINIEGGEYELLEHLINANFTGNIINFQIQFHSFVPSAELRMRAIQEQLSTTHKLTYQYPFIWENWKLKHDHC